MMFRRRGLLASTSLALLLFAITTHGQQTNSRSYDTNDWIPVSRPSSQQTEDHQSEATQKRPTGRVLNLPASDQKRFYPTEQSGIPQTYRVPLKQSVDQAQGQFQQPPPKYQPELTTYVPNGQQQILLPPQLQSIINQNQPYLTPQRINTQLLQQKERDYLPTLQSVPNQQFVLNGSEFNTRDVVQNINLGLYNQQKQHHHQQQNDNEQPEVQLLYVPLENLRQRGQRQQVVFPTEQAVPTSQAYSQPIPQQYQQHNHKQVQLDNIQQDFVQQALQAQKLQEQFQHNIQPVPQQQFQRQYHPEVVTQAPSTSPAPKKRKPHQPPLAVYMETEGHQDIKIGDVLTILKDAKTISVQDNIGPDSPQVFVGPSHLEPPEGYTKFELPYLSSIENNRVERKVDQLPFFVAPLSYKAPAGYSKIPFPAPHVGSVVINHKKATQESPSTEHPQRYVPETSSHAPYAKPEASSIRTRGRQRQPVRNSYTASTVQTPVSSEIPYGPIPTKISPVVQEQHSVQESLISPNPYGPTQFVQSTTPALYDKPASLPDQIFLTKNRFSTAAPPYNTQNVQHSPIRQSQFAPRQEASSTEPSAVPSTISATQANDKYTVLEQFPISHKATAGRHQQDNDHSQRVPQRHHSRPRPTEDYYNEETEVKSPLPLVSTQGALDQYYDHNIPTRSTYTQKQQNVQLSTQDSREQYYQDDIPSRATYTQNQQDAQEYIPKQVISENYRHQTQKPVVQETPAQTQAQEHHEQQFTTLQSNQQFESPQGSRVRGQQQYSSENYYQPQQINDKPYEQEEELKHHSNHQYISQEITSPKSQLARGRGKQHFTPDADEFYREQYESHSLKPTEQTVTITKEPVIKYEIPVSSTQRPTDIKLQPPYLPETYYNQHEQVQDPHQQEYTLPKELPPISPQLPGLINSLQDQAQRQLLAPLLLPPSEQPPIAEEEPEYYPSPSPTPTPTPTTTTTTTTTTTEAPLVETTTQFKRTRGRQRATRPTVSYDYVNTTPASRRPSSSSRGRRPYNGQPRQEFRHRESVPVSSTVHPEVITESTTRAVFSRNRHAGQRERQYVSSTTELPRRAPVNTRQRFRTRGRPVKTEEEYIERSTPENVPTFKEPILEGGFQASVPLVHSPEPPTNIHNPVSEEPHRHVLLHRPQQEQALLYIEKQPIQESSSEEYNPRQQHYSSSTEALEPLHHSTIAVSGPDNNIVSDVVHNEPTVLITPSVSPQQIKYSQTTEPIIDYHPRVETNVNSPRVKYNEEPEIKEHSTTEYTRTRVRTRGKPRVRGPSSRHQSPSPVSSTTTHRTTTESKQEDSGEEFYGFFRPPNFAKPVQTELKQSPEVHPSPRPTPTVSYIRPNEDQDQRVYVSSTINPVSSTSSGYLPVTHIEDNRADPNIQTQYVSSSLPSHSASTSSEEEVVDIKPVTRRPFNNFNRANRRPAGPARAEVNSEVTTQTTEKYYARPSKRPETQTPKLTRIRGRIRKPSRPTPTPARETDNTYSHSPRTNELDNNHSEENVAPVKTRQRLTSRGKSHFHPPGGERSVTREPEVENYPTSFLQAHGLAPQQSEIVLSTAESLTQKPVTQNIQTPKPTFQLTIEPEESEEEYSDQIPYSSVNKPTITTKDLEDGEESKFSPKIVEKPTNFNYIVSDEKTYFNQRTTSESSAQTEETSTENNTNVSSEEPKDTTEQVTTIDSEVTDTPDAPTTEIPTTTLETETDKPNGRRRGVWRLVKTRPVGDDFESAESQNVPILTNNDFSAEKPIRKYHSVKRIRTSTEPLQYETTTLPQPETTASQFNEPEVDNKQDSSKVRDLFAPLYEMFGYTREGNTMQNNDDTFALQSDDSFDNKFDTTTTEQPSFNTQSYELETTTLVVNTTETNQNDNKEEKVMMYSDRMEDLSEKEQQISDEAWQTRIIGTSTTTEISHETEICYRGRCIKSATSEENSENL